MNISYLAVKLLPQPGPWHNLKPNLGLGLGLGSELGWALSRAPDPMSMRVEILDG